jgi:hypothetical protein
MNVKALQSPMLTPETRGAPLHMGIRRTPVYTTKFLKYTAIRYQDSKIAHGAEVGSSRAPHFDGANR